MCWLWRFILFDRWRGRFRRFRRGMPPFTIENVINQLAQAVFLGLRVFEDDQFGASHSFPALSFVVRLFLGIFLPLGFGDRGAQKLSVRVEFDRLPLRRPFLLAGWISVIWSVLRRARCPFSRVRMISRICGGRGRGKVRFRTRSCFCWQFGFAHENIKLCGFLSLRRIVLRRYILGYRSMCGTLFTMPIRLSSFSSPRVGIVLQSLVDRSGCLERRQFVRLKIRRFRSPIWLFGHRLGSLAGRRVPLGVSW